MTQDEYTARGIQLLHTMMVNGEAKESFPQNSLEPVILTVESLHNLYSYPDMANKLMGYRGPILLTLPAAFGLARNIFDQSAPK